MHLVIGSRDLAACCGPLPLSGPLEASRHHAGEHRASPERYRCARRRWQRRGHLVENPDQVTPQPLPSGDLHSPSSRLQGRCSWYAVELHSSQRCSSLCAPRVVWSSNDGETDTIIVQLVVLVVMRAVQDMFDCPWPPAPAPSHLLLPMIAGIGRVIPDACCCFQPLIWFNTAVAFSYSFPSTLASYCPLSRESRDGHTSGPSNHRRQPPSPTRPCSSPLGRATWACSKGPPSSAGERASWT